VTPTPRSLANRTPARQPQHLRSPSRPAPTVATDSASSRLSSTASAFAIPHSLDDDRDTRAHFDSSRNPRTLPRHAHALPPLGADARYPHAGELQRSPRRASRRPSARNGPALRVHALASALLTRPGTEAFPIALTPRDEPTGFLNTGFELGCARSKPHLVIRHIRLVSIMLRCRHRSLPMPDMRG
jgi:hypothetical protein